MMFEYPVYRALTIECPLCKWRGKGDQLENDEYHPESNILDLNCPACYEHIGFIQFPIAPDKHTDKAEDKKYW